MEFRESTDHRDLRSTIRKLGTKYGHAYFVEKARQGEHVTELWKELISGGFAGVNISEEYGGPGGDLYDLMIVAEELAAAGNPLMTLVVSPAICGPLLEAFGTDEQKERWLTGIGTGEERMAFAITEPDAGSNSHRLRTTAVRDGDDWVLNGSKYYISGVDDARSILVVAKTGTDDRGRGILSCFVVEKDTPGFGFTPIPTQVVAAERQFTLTFDDARVPAHALIPPEGGGLKQLFVGLNPERIMSAAICCGIARYCLEKAVGYANDRQVWDAPIGAHQAIAHPLARAHMQLVQAQLLNQKAAWMQTEGLDCGAEANMAKFSAAEAAAFALDVAIQTHGGNGLSDEFGLADLYGLTRLYGIAPVSREMILNYVSHGVLGLPRSY